MLSPTPPIDRPSLHPGTGYLIGPRVPHGLAAVVEGLTREVLRHRPEDIYVFAAHHFEKLLKLREQYHAEEYGGGEFDGELGREFNLWPTKESGDNGGSSIGGRSTDKELDSSLEKREKACAEYVEESAEEAVVPNEAPKGASKKQVCPGRAPSNARRTTRKSTKDSAETMPDPRATRMISRMSVSHGHHGRNILTKDIKQELRRNKLSGEKGKTDDDTERGIRGERRSRTRASKPDRDTEGKVECITTMTTTTTTTSSRTSTLKKRPLKKVRRIETESETETERETAAAKAGLENGRERSSVKGDSAGRVATLVRSGSGDGRPEATAARLSEHSSGRKVSSRALSMDRIRAYVLRKFASTASLEVLRSPTYVEQVQEVIDRAAPIIKEKLEEMRRPRGKRSRSVDLAWNEEQLFRHRHARDGERRDREEAGENGRRGDQAERGKSDGGSERGRADTANGNETEDSAQLPGEDRSSGRDETISNLAEREETQRSGRRSVGSGKRSRRRESNGHFGDFDDDSTRRGDGSEREPSGASHDTLEARLTATRSLLEGISMSTSEPGGGVRGIDPADDGGEREPTASESAGLADHVVSLPIVRPPSARNGCRSAARNGTDSGVTLPPISPEAPRSTKKRDELSLPVLAGNHSAAKSQEQDGFKDTEEASTMRDITSDMEDIAALPEDGLHEDAIADAKQDPSIGDGRWDLVGPEVTRSQEDEEKEDGEANQVPRSEDFVARELADASLDRELRTFEESAEPEEERTEEIFKDSLNVTPEVVDVPARPDSLEPPDDESTDERDGREKSREDDDGSRVITRDNVASDGLRDRLIEIEMAERSIEKALAGQQERGDEGTSEAEMAAATDDGRMANGASGSTFNEKAEEVESSEGGKSTDVGRISNGGDGKSMNGAGEPAKSPNSSATAEPKEPADVRAAASSRSRDQSDRIVTVRGNTGENNHDDDEDDNGGDDVTKRRHAEMANVSSSPDITVSGDAAIEGEDTNSHPDGRSGVTKARKKRQINDESPARTPLSLEVPFSYVLSEGSPCEIPDSVTTVIIPDRPCPLVTSGVEFGSPSLESIDATEDSNVRSSSAIAEGDASRPSSRDETPVAENTAEEEARHVADVAFGEYIRPDMPPAADIDFVRGARGARPSQDLVIVHQDLDRIKEEREEEEEERDVGDEREEGKGRREKKDDDADDDDDERAVVRDERSAKLATLEDIVEREEIEETDARTIPPGSIGTNDAEEIPPTTRVPESSCSTAESTADARFTDATGADVAPECSGSAPENSSEESGSSQDTRTTTSSDAKESTASNRSIESPPSAGRPLVPELNLDSLQDNTVSSFKMTANGTATKGSNDASPRESDATMSSFVEPLTPDERAAAIGNRLTDREVEAAVGEPARSGSSRDPQSELPEVDRPYRAAAGRAESLERDPLSSETILVDEARPREAEVADSKTLREEDTARVDSPLREERAEEAQELGSEEEIARELIDSLDEAMHLRASRELESLKKRSEDRAGKPAEGNLDDVDDKSDETILEFVHPVAVDRSEKREREVSSGRAEALINVDEEIAKAEAASELSDTLASISQNNEDEDGEKLKNGEHEESKLETGEKEAESKRDDEFLEQNGRPKVTDGEIIGEKQPEDAIDADSTDNQKKPGDEKTSVEEILKSQSNESVSEVEEFREKREESERDELKDGEKCEQEAARKETIEDNNDIGYDNGTGPTRSINRDAVVDRTEKDARSERRGKMEDLSVKVESVHGPITSAISEQSSEDNSRDNRYWTAGTKSSTAETVIAAFGSKMSADEKTETHDDALEVVESSARRKDDFYSAAVKIQAYVRGFLARHRMRKNLCPRPVSADISLAHKTTTGEYLIVPEDRSNLREAKSGRQRLRREEALRKTTLSLENAFVTGRLQHTSEFHDSVPLPLFETANSETSETPSNESSGREAEENAEARRPDVTKPSTNGNYDRSAHDDKSRGDFEKGNAFDHAAFPIVMHLLADASRNCHFRVGRNADSDLGGGTERAEPAMDILMMGYGPTRDDEAALQNHYLNFITSVEDTATNMNSLLLRDAIERTKGADEADPSISASAEGSLREPLALPGTPQGVVIEEVTSLDEDVSSTTGLSESTKPSTAPRSSLDTNGSAEERALEDQAKSDLGQSPRRTSPAGKGDVIGHRRNTDAGAERQPGEIEDLANVGGVDSSRDEDANGRDKISRNSNGYVDGTGRYEETRIADQRSAK